MVRNTAHKSARHPSCSVDELPQNCMKFRVVSVSGVYLNGELGAISWEQDLDLVFCESAFGAHLPDLLAQRP